MLPLLPVKLLPSKELPSLSVDFSMPGNSSRVVEQEVTSRLEGAFSRIEGLKRIESRSGNGKGNVRMEFDRHADMDMARLEVSTIIRRLWTELPEGVSYPTVAYGGGRSEKSSPFMTFTITAPGNSTEIASYVEENLKPVIADIKGVEGVDIHGVTPMEWRLEYDADRIAALGLTPSDITEAIRGHNSTEFLGTAGEGDHIVSLVRKSSGAGRDFDPSEIIVTTPAGTDIPLDKIVSAVRTEGKPTSYFRINGLNSIYLNVSATEEANQLEVSALVDSAIGRIAEKTPEGMTISKANDDTDTIRKELDKIYLRTGLTVLILLLFIVAATRNLRYTLLIVISLAVNLAVAVILYRLSDIEIQLYSLAGITISLNLVIDNTIVMCDHYMRHRDRKAFPAILAATLTTAGALAVVFLLNEEVRRDLEDFVMVVIVNLLVSLAVALLLVPALADRIGMRRRKSRHRQLSRRISRLLTRAYGGYISFALRWKWALFLLMAAGIGVSGWLFFERVREGNYFGRDEGEKILYINASLPNGSTLAQMDALMRKMESYLAGFDEIRQFQTNIHSGRRCGISVRFTEEAAASGFPYRLKSDVIVKALSLGGGSWNVYGLEDNGFSNDIRETSGNSRISMYGFDYDELWNLALELRDSLLSHRRIKEVDIKSDFSYWKEDYSEFSLTIDKEALAHHGITAEEFRKALEPLFGRDIDCGRTGYGNTEKIRLSSRQSGDYDVWALMNILITVGDRSLRVSDVAEFEKGSSPQDVVKENQSYRLCLQYEYIGSPEQGEKLLERTVEETSRRLPAGYTVESDEYKWNGADKDYSSYGILGVIVMIIFFLSAILFNSLLDPMAIIAIIPISYVGIFLTFQIFDLRFDQGGFASFILLSGITVNAAIYVIYEMRRRGEGSSRGSRLSKANYLRAFRAKAGPIVLTVISTVLGFIPFLAGTEKESFWYALAAGTIGGLLFSLPAIVLYLPLLIMGRKTPEKGRRHAVKMKTAGQ